MTDFLASLLNTQTQTGLFAYFPSTSMFTTTKCTSVYSYSGLFLL